MGPSRKEESALREMIARELTGARRRTALLTDSVDEADLVRQHSPLMSPLVWDLAHIANQEELWLLREVGGREPMHPEVTSARPMPAIRGCARPGPGRPTRISAGPVGSASKPPTRPWAGPARPRRSARR